MRLSEYLLLASATAVSAWLPGEHKSLVARDGQNLFNNDTVPSSYSKRWLPASGKIRGVNLGSQFIVEPWMASNEWNNNMGCNNACSEFDCVSALGQSQADSVWAAHWARWITQDDINEMVSYGLNTIRIPVGYWIDESLKYDSEHFPNGGLAYLEQICGWASDAGMYIIIDLHGAPYAQDPQQPFTGQCAPSAGFYQQGQYDRAYQFLSWMTNIIHTTNAYRNVGMIEVLNEPSTDSSVYNDLDSNYYVNAYSTIRNVESSLGITANNYLHIQYMNAKWGSGNPADYLPNNYFAAYDDHRYIKYDTSVATSHDAYISASCNDDRGGNTPTIVGEWSLSPNSDVENDSDWTASDNIAFYQEWFGAQVQAYEKQQGWIFWTWKTDLNDPRWGYRDAVNAGIIPTDLNNVPNPC